MVKDESQIESIKEELIKINDKGKYKDILDNIKVEIGTFLE